MPTATNPTKIFMSNIFERAFENSWIVRRTSGGLILWQSSNALINGCYLNLLVYDGHLLWTPSGPIGGVQKSGSAQVAALRGEGCWPWEVRQSCSVSCGHGDLLISADRTQFSVCARRLASEGLALNQDRFTPLHCRFCTCMSVRVDCWKVDFTFVSMEGHLCW